jgi:hypothetical protein
MSVFKRKRKLSDGTTLEDSTFSIKFNWQGEQILRKTPYTRREDAERVLKELKRTAHSGAWHQARQTLDNLRLRKTVPEIETTSIDTICAAYEKHTLIKPLTARANVCALLRAIAKVCGAAPDPRTQPISVLDSNFIWSWRKAIAESVRDATPEIQKRTYGSANSAMSQARCLFTSEMRSAYLQYEKIKLPETLRGFIEEPLFPQPKKKSDYKKPSDAILAKTFQSLEDLRHTDLNAYRAVWLAIGFALRKGEIRLARTTWFITRDGKPYLLGDKLSKDHLLPDIKCHAGAWEKLAAVLPAGDTYVLEGDNTERCHKTFARIGALGCGSWDGEHKRPFTNSAPGASARSYRMAAHCATPSSLPATAASPPPKKITAGTSAPPSAKPTSQFQRLPTSKSSPPAENHGYELGYHKTPPHPITPPHNTNLYKRPSILPIPTQSAPYPSNPAKKRRDPRTNNLSNQLNFSHEVKIRSVLPLHYLQLRRLS